MRVFRIVLAGALLAASAVSSGCGGGQTVERPDEVSPMIDDAKTGESPPAPEQPPE